MISLLWALLMYEATSGQGAEAGAGADTPASFASLAMQAALRTVATLPYTQTHGTSDYFSQLLCHRVLSQLFITTFHRL